MRPRTNFYITIFGFSVMGIVFLIVDIYAFNVFLASDSRYNHMWWAGVGCIFFGIGILRLVVYWARKPEAFLRNEFGECPFCGDILKEDATLCTKCGRQITE